ISAAMIEAGRRRPGGDNARLRWLAGAAETVPLPGRYALVTAGASLHWMDWALVLLAGRPGHDAGRETGHRRAQLRTAAVARRAAEDHRQAFPGHRLRSG